MTTATFAKTIRLVGRELEERSRLATSSESAKRLLSKFSGWLTVGRVTTHAAIAASLVWLMFIFNLSRPGLLDRLGDLKGTDFLQFYAAGSFAKAHRIGEMYGVHQFAEATARAIPGVQGWHYLPVYPPQVALMFWPFAHAPYLMAFAMWTLVNLSLYAGCLALMARLYPKIATHPVAFILATLAFPPFFNAIGHGQLSILMLGCVVASLYAFIRDEQLIAGLALGCIAFKPPLFIAFMIAWLVVREFRVVTGMIINSAAQLAVVCLFAGLNSIRAYLEFAVRLPRVDALVLAVKPYQMHSIRSFWMLLGAGRLELELWLLSSLAVLAMLARFWRRAPARDMRFAALIMAALLIDPHLYIYDAVLLAPALIVAIERARLLGPTVGANAIQVGVYVLFVCLFLGPLSGITHLQLSVLVMTALFFAMTRPLGRAA
jgi:Glycosyltransferase family 87